MYGCLWAYTAVFANASASALPFPKSWGLGDDDYLIWVGVFSLLVVPFTCMELKEQVGVQVFLSGCRFAMVVLMVFSVSVAMLASAGEDKANEKPQFDDQSDAEGSNLFNLSGFYKILPIAVYANIFHHSIPGLSMPVENKEMLAKIFERVFIFMFVAYGLIGVVVAWYFGDNLVSEKQL